MDKGKAQLTLDQEAQQNREQSDDASGSGAAYVRPLEDCPHLQSSGVLSSKDLPQITSACKACDDAAENWGCLQCGQVYCSRYVRGHMVQHVSGTGHPIAVSFSDLSIWCFPCEQYLNGLTNPKLRPLLDGLHHQKFGERLPEARHEIHLA